MAKLSISSGNAVVNAAGEELFVRGQGDHGSEEEPRVVGDLDNAEKLALVEAHQKTVIANLANARKLNVAVDTVKAEEKLSEHTV